MPAGRVASPQAQITPRFFEHAPVIYWKCEGAGIVTPNIHDMDCVDDSDKVSRALYLNRNAQRMPNRGKYSVTRTKEEISKEISNEILRVFRENRKMLKKKQLDIKRAQNQSVPTEDMQTRNEEDSGEGLRD
jgi:hypothetical protein